MTPPTSYATVDEYRQDTGDVASDEGRVASAVAQQSAKLRAMLGIDASRELTPDQRALARALVVDAVRKALVPPTLDGVGDVAGASAASFGANGFTQSVTFANPSGSAWFDRSTLAALKRSLGTSQRIGTVYPGGVL